VLGSLALVLAPLASAGGPELPAFFSDHMVFQRQTTAPMWGWTGPYEDVTVTPSWPGARKLTTRADERGRWRLELRTPGPGGPYTIAIDSVSGARVLQDVLVGEVWLAAGQSNMEWTVGPVVGEGVQDWETTAKASLDPELRIFDVANAVTAAPIDAVRGSWRAANPESVLSFSATAYFFARKLRDDLRVPVGVITADWGGTPAEAWTRRDALTPFPDFAPGLARLRALDGDPVGARAAIARERAAWWERLAMKDTVAGARASDAAAAAEPGWSALALPQTFEQHGLAAFDGVAWYRRTVAVPDAWKGKDLVVELGTIDDCDTTFWNGAPLGAHEEDGAYAAQRVYTVPAARVAAHNVIAVRVLDTGGYGGFSGGALAIGPAGGAGEPQSLAGEWQWRKGPALGDLGPMPATDALSPNEPSVLWNAMIAPLVPYAFQGVIWYQGEANVGRADQYRHLFPALITSWRSAWDRDFPFLFVQLAPFAYDGDRGAAAALRDVQRRTLGLPGTGMAVTMDIGDPADIHPKNKRDVGTRLALWALARTYHKELRYSGPLFAGAEREGAALRVYFEHAEGLTSRGDPVQHVIVAGEDRVFHPADVQIDGETLLVSCPEVPAPVAVRFGWGASDETNLWNANGLPAACFRNDDWP